RAIKATEEESNMLEGVKMIYCSLVNLLNKYEVIEIDCLNKEFDPTFAQAVIQEPSEEVESGIVIDILQKGYTLKGKVIRPAMVKVSE
ncbi:MAG: nucleotide exchange factor GrpE, partial [Lachnospiraceae bacterium]